MNIKSLYDIVMLYQYKTMLEENHKFIFSKINFLSLRNEQNEQFAIINISEDYIKFKDNIRKKVFEMIKKEPYSCGKFYYDVNVIEEWGEFLWVEK